MSLPHSQPGASYLAEMSDGQAGRQAGRHTLITERGECYAYIRACMSVPRTIWLHMHILLPRRRSISSQDQLVYIDSYSFMYDGGGGGGDLAKCCNK